MSTAVIIPARLASSRFHAKPLALIAGRPLIEHVVERVAGSRVDRIVVTTDSDLIAQAVAGLPCDVHMSRPDHACGTDRIAETAATLAEDLILNVQGDQLIEGPHVIDAILDALKPDVRAATLFAPLGDEDPTDVNVVKVVAAADGRIIYMSRFPIPYDRPGDGVSRFRQIGIYAFAREALLDIASLAPCELEHREGVELLRALHYGVRLDGVLAPWSFQDVDVPADVALAEAYLTTHPLTASDSE